MQVIPIAGMVAGNAMVAVGLCYNQLGLRFHSEQQQIQKIKFGRNAENGLRRAYPR